MTSTVESRSLSAYQLRADGLAIGTPARMVATLRLEELLYLIRVRWAAANISATCSRIDVILNGVVNPNRPYTSWTCCAYHRDLRGTKEQLLNRALQLGVVLALDAQTPITP
jgi:hypothetical protein